MLRAKDGGGQMIVTPEDKSPEDYIIECMTNEDAEYDINTLIEAMAVVMATAIIKKRVADERDAYEKEKVQ